MTASNPQSRPSETGRPYAATPAALPPEAALRISEERFHLAMDATTDGIWDWDIQAESVYYSPNYTRMLGYEPEAFTSLIGAWADLIHPEDHARVLAANEACIQGVCENFEVEYRMKARDGSMKWILGRGKAITRDARGRATRMVGTHVDVTGRKEMEASLRASEIRYRNLFNNSAVGMFRTRLDGSEILDFNDKYLQLIGKTLDEVMHKPSTMVWADPETRTEMVRLLEAHGHVTNFEMRVITTSGQILDCLTSVKLFREEGIIEGSLHDISDRIAHERDLLRLNRVYNMLGHLGQTLPQMTSREALFQEFCTIAVERGGFRLAWIGWIEAGTGRVVPVSCAGEAVGYLEGIEVWAQERPEGLSPTAIALLENRTYVCQDFYSDSVMVPWLGQARAYGLRSSVTIPIRMRDQVVGALKVYTGEAKIFQDQEVVLLEEAASHLSYGLEQLNADRHRRQLETELAHAQKMDSLGSLAGGVAHDMNNVLGAILGLASMQEDQAPEGSALKQSMRTIAKACQRGATMVKGLLGFARQGLAEEKVLDLNSLVREEVALLERTTFQRVELDMDLAKNLWPMTGDAGALIHALMNLCVNAVDAMPNGGTLTLRTLNGADGMVVLEVADTGSGMPREILDKAMDPFFTTKPQGKGTGLGLAIVYGTVKAHRGTVAMRSEPGHGTRVTMRFPSCRTQTEASGGAPEAERAMPPRTMQVLVVDDDELMQSSLAAMLGNLGHTVTACACGEDALAALEAGYQPEAVLLDMNMPGLGGAATLLHLRALRPDVPVIIATGRADLEALTLVETFKRVTLLTKPFGQPELERQLRALPRPSGGAL